MGAGNTQFGKALLVDNPELKYDAVEPDGEVRKRYGTWVRASFQNLNEIGKIKYELIVLNHVLEHSNDPVGFLKKIGTLSKTNGYIYIDVPYHDYIYKPSVEPHLFFWNRISLQIALEQANYEILFCDTAGMTLRKAHRFYAKRSI